jgi:4'-phosphopantetheinyl transferase
VTLRTTGPEPSVPLANREVHLRTVVLEQPAEVCDRLFALLSGDERRRAARFMFDRDRRAYIVCRGTLRLALGEYLARPAASLRFVYGTRGKPALHRKDVEFNVSHAAGIGVFAFARAGAVGVDVESLDRTVEFEELATRFFSEVEARELTSIPESMRAEAFFNCWTRKEAYIKAVGEGLACPLDSFAVSLLPGAPPAMRWIRGEDAKAWRLAAFRPTPHHVAALGTAWTPSHVRMVDWPLWTEQQEPVRTDRSDRGTR